MMLRPTTPADFGTILAIINDGARAYAGVIPADRLRSPYMSADELAHEISLGVTFHGLEHPAGSLVAVMGIQSIDHPTHPVTLIRHAYTATASQGSGLGTQLLAHLRALTARPILIGTWSDSHWAIRFYRKHGFELVSPEEKDRLLRLYWTVPERQIETSVVLADDHWRSLPDRP